MLHIVLMLLKLIGTILAIILGILVVAIFVVLIVPLRYKGEARAFGSVESFNVNLKFSWLFRLITGYVIYENKTTIWQMRILGKKKKPKKETAKTENTRERKSFQNIKYTTTNICDKIKLLTRKKDELKQFLEDEVHQMAWKCLSKELFWLWKILRPRKLEADLRFGFEDPSVTGKVLAFISMAYPFYPNTIHIVPDFEEEVFEGDVSFAGKIRGVHLLKVVWNLFRDKNIRTTYKKLNLGGRTNGK